MLNPQLLKHLKEIEKIWPDDLCLMPISGFLHVMQKTDEIYHGKKVKWHCIATYNIPTFCNDILPPIF